MGRRLGIRFVVASDQMPLSHEFLSMMLGVRRAGVTVALGGLKAAS
jgi:CRP-like cAMP-binding protein